MPKELLRRKKRPRLFLGTPVVVGALARSPPHSPGVEVPVTPPVETPQPIKTASSNKLDISRGWSSQPSTSGEHFECEPSESESESDYEPVESMKGYRPLDCEILGQVVSDACVCSVCNSPLVVKEVLAQRRGLVSTLTICCTNAEYSGKESNLSDPYSSKSKSLNAS